MKIRIPHPHFQCSKVKHEHFRKVLFFACAAFAIAHFCWPGLESVVGIACNFLFFYEPVITI